MSLRPPPTRPRVPYLMSTSPSSRVPKSQVPSPKSQVPTHASRCPRPLVPVPLLYTAIAIVVRRFLWCSLSSSVICKNNQRSYGCVAGVETGVVKKRKREGDWGERGRDACYKNPLLFLGALASVNSCLAEP